MGNEKVVEPLVVSAWPDTGKLLGLGRNAVYAAIARGEIPSIRIGKRILVPKAALDRMLAGAVAGEVLNRPRRATS